MQSRWATYTRPPATAATQARAGQLETIARCHSCAPVTKLRATSCPVRTAYIRFACTTGALQPSAQLYSTSGFSAAAAKPRTQPTVAALAAVIWVAVVFARLPDASWSACVQSPPVPDAVAAPAASNTAAPVANITSVLLPYRMSAPSRAAPVPPRAILRRSCWIRGAFGQQAGKAAASATEDTTSGTALDAREWSLPPARLGRGTGSAARGSAGPWLWSASPAPPTGSAWRRPG